MFSVCFQAKSFRRPLWTNYPMTNSGKCSTVVLSSSVTYFIHPAYYPGPGHRRFSRKFCLWGKRYHYKRIYATTGAKIALNGKGAKVDMCKAIQEMREIEFAQGHSLEIEQGVQKGRRQGFQQAPRVFIQNYQEETLPPKRLTAKLQKFFSLSNQRRSNSFHRKIQLIPRSFHLHT